METERNLLTTTEAAKYLGLKPSYLYKLMMRRAIPYYKPNGKLCFFSKADLDTWLTNIRVKSQAEIDSDAAQYLVNRCTTSNEHSNEIQTSIKQYSKTI